jgi:hypothetical protein
MITIIFVLLVVGVVLWLINNYVPMAGPIKTLLNAVVVIVLILECRRGDSSDLVAATRVRTHLRRSPGATAWVRSDPEDLLSHRIEHQFGRIVETQLLHQVGAMRIHC